jgi:hypothetical protein
MDDTTWLQLNKEPRSSKIFYVGYQRWLVNKNDPWRMSGDLFKHKEELRGPPCKRSRKEI